MMHENYLMHSLPPVREPHDCHPSVPTRKKPSPKLAITILALVGIVVALMQTLAVPLIPQLPLLLDS